MKNVLIPTDFSAGALTASRYAAALAVGKDWNLILCHAFKPFGTVFQGRWQNQHDEERAVEETDAQMNSLLKKLRKDYPSLSISGVCIEGDVAEVILQQSGQRKARFIVMGTKGATGLKYALLGSNTYEIICKAPVPVLAVPERVKTFNLRKAGFAFNYHGTEISALEGFLDLVEEPVEVVMFHLYENEKREQALKMALWKDRFEKITAYPRLYFKMALTRDLPAGINRFIKKEKLDALVMTAVDKRLVDRLFTPKLVKVVAHHPLVPVFFMKES